ncbi:hypothetical protein DQ384_37575 [Sphaerisporangium album]|uniref:Uncharacterized protein n=1 Tax=Sphaerisporangium album TaxID=509200 RepID=A0A367EQ22_9ACTN|nr:hypothetical protein [Sphaerisporangium album]RCG20073.1 hypothetical protein DQ384_37575 [Sphaerisporangium album]
MSSPWDFVPVALVCGAWALILHRLMVRWRNRRWAQEEASAVMRSSLSERDRTVPAGGVGVYVIGTIRDGGQDVRMSWPEVVELARRESRGGLLGCEVFVTSREGGVVQTWVWRGGVRVGRFRDVKPWE